MDFKKKIRTIFNVFGIDLVRLNHSPKQTMLGLRSLKISTVIDVGANEGQFGKSILKVFPQADLYCFEPLEVPFKKLRAWTDSIGNRVQCFNVALGDQEGALEMHYHNEHSPSSSLLASTAHGHQTYPQTISENITTVRVTTLDNFSGSHLNQITNGIMLKLDVQGFEDRVLRGAYKLLQKCDACMLEVCLDPLYEGQANFPDLVEILTRAGFKYSGNVDQTYGKDGRVIFFDALFLK